MAGSSWGYLKTPDIEALRRVAAGQVDLEACPHCRGTPDKYEVLERGEDEHPFRAHLQGRAFLKHCPLSGACYFQGHTYEYLAGGSEDLYTYSRVSPARAQEILDEWAAELAAAPGPKPQS